MLPHYSAYKVAENFRVLEGLTPGRIDLGLGRAPGGMPIASWALNDGGKRNADQYPQQIKELTMYLHDLADDKHRFPNLTAAPHISTAPDVWLLGSSGENASSPRNLALAICLPILSMERAERVLSDSIRGDSNRLC